jgi:2-hydroxychromene-2-carboxylate isomerase
MTAPVELYFDIGSAYSYLASTQLEGLTERTGRPVVWRPMLLGAVFKATGNSMPAAVPAKGAYLLVDLLRWAHHYRIPVSVPSRFPLNTLRTQRALVAASLSAGDEATARFGMMLFRAYWVDDRDVSADEELARAATLAGLPAVEIVAAIDAQATKDALRKNTDDAVRRGAFGAPTFFVGDDMFFGNDRLPLLEEHLLGVR